MGPSVPGKHLENGSWGSLGSQESLHTQHVGMVESFRYHFTQSCLGSPKTLMDVCGYVPGEMGKPNTLGPWGLQHMLVIFNVYN